MQLGSCGGKGLLGEGLGGLAARHHGVVQREGVLLFPLRETARAQGLSGPVGQLKGLPRPRPGAHLTAQWVCGPASCCPRAQRDVDFRAGRGGGLPRHKASCSGIFSEATDPHG